MVLLLSHNATKKIRVKVLWDNGSTLGINLQRKGLVGTYELHIAWQWVDIEDWGHFGQYHKHTLFGHTKHQYISWNFRAVPWLTLGSMSIPPIMRNNHVRGFWSVSDAVYDIYDVSMALEFSNISIFQPHLLKSNIQFFKFLCVKTTSVSSHPGSWGMCWLRDMVQ